MNVAKSLEYLHILTFKQKQILTKIFLKYFLYNLNYKVKSNALMLENIKLKRLRLLQYFHTSIYHHYQRNKSPT